MTVDPKGASAFRALESLLYVLFGELIRSIARILRAYFRFLEASFGGTRTLDKVDRILRFFEGPTASVDERIARIDEARANLAEGLAAIDQLKLEAEQNKRELDEAVKQITHLQAEREVAAKELDAIKTIAGTDTSTLRKVIGIPSPSRIWLERFYGFISGIFASLIASAIWWLATR